jgi:hypothetical protein
VFYTKMAKLFVKKYGRDLADDQDFAVDVADPPDSAANEVVHEVLSEEEKGFRAAHHKALWTVRELYLKGERGTYCEYRGSGTGTGGSMALC